MTTPVAARSREFRATKRDHARWPLNFLAGLVLLYGLSLTVVVPWLVGTALLTADQGQPDRAFGVGSGLLLIGLSVTILTRWLIVQSMAFYGFDRLRRQRAEPPSAAPLVSILVPAYNESETVVGALTSLIELDYPHYEIVFVDDGSSDDTFVKAFPLAGEYPNCSLRVFTKPNGGKWSALNHAFAKARGDLLLCVDADSGLARDALRMMVPRLAEDGVVGCSGQVTIRNRETLLTRLQATEYLVANGGLRMAQSLIGSVTVVPGPIGLYTRAVLQKIATLPKRIGGTAAAAHGGAGAVEGPFSGETFAEDFHLSLSALALGGRLVYEPRAHAYTKCPDTVTGLMNQRYRWIRGTLQVYCLYATQLHKLTGGRHGRVLATVMHAIYPVDLFVIPFFNFYTWTVVAVSLAHGQSVAFIAGSIGSIAFLNVMTALIYVLEQDEQVTLVALIPLLDLYVGILVNTAWLISMIDQARNTSMRWS